MSSKTLNLYLGTLKERWLDFCLKKGLKSGDELRRYIEECLKDNNVDELNKKSTSKQKMDSVDDGIKIRYEIRLTPSERESINLHAEKENCSPSKWAVNTIRSGLTLEPQFTIEEIKTLWESSSQLRSVGRNLNQIAKHLNSVNHIDNKDVLLTVDKINTLALFIENHTEHVSKLIHASSERSLIIGQNINDK